MAPQPDHKTATMTRPDDESPSRKRVLLAEDDKELRILVRQALIRAGFAVTDCSNGIQLLDRLSAFLTPPSHEDYALVISDVRMPGLTGMEILAGFSDRPGFPPMVVITAFGDTETRLEAEKHGAAAYFDKPFDINALVEKVCDIVPP